MPVPSRPKVLKPGRKCFLNTGVQENISWCSDTKHPAQKTKQNNNNKKKTKTTKNTKTRRVRRSNCLLSTHNLAIVPFPSVSGLAGKRHGVWAEPVTLTHPDHKGA